MNEVNLQRITGGIVRSEGAWRLKYIDPATIEESFWRVTREPLGSAHPERGEVNVAIYAHRQMAVTYQTKQNGWVWRARHARFAPPVRPTIGNDPPQGIPREEIYDLINSGGWAFVSDLDEAFRRQLAVKLEMEPEAPEIRAIGGRLAEATTKALESYLPEPESARFTTTELFVSKWNAVVRFGDALMDTSKVAAAIGKAIATPATSLITTGSLIVSLDDVISAFVAAGEALRASRSWVVRLHETNERSVMEAIMELTHIMRVESASTFISAPNAPEYPTTEQIINHLCGRIGHDEVEVRGDKQDGLRVDQDG